LGIYLKNKRTIINVIKIFILICAYTYIYFKFKEIRFTEISEFSNYQYLIYVILLMPINWLFESKKWQLLISKFEDISLLQSFKAIFTGITTSVFTPNRVGEFVGRVMFVSEDNRAKAVVSTIIGSYSQVLITFIIGAFSFFFINKGQINFIDNNLYLKWVFVVIAVILVILFFNMRVFKLIFGRYNNKHIISIVDTVSGYSFFELLKVIVISFLRYVVFFIQFYLLLVFFNVDITLFESFITVGLFYLFLMFIPTFVISEPGVRISTSIMVFSFYVNDISMIVYTVSLLWVINIVLPTLLGSVLLIKRKI